MMCIYSDTNLATSLALNKECIRILIINTKVKRLCSLWLIKLYCPVASLNCRFTHKCQY